MNKDKRRIKLENYLSTFDNKIKKEQRNLDKKISKDDVLNIKICLNTINSVDEFLGCIC